MRFLKVLILIIPYVTFAQESNFNTAVKLLNEQLEIYQTQSPFGSESYAVKDLKLSKIETILYLNDEGLKVTDSIDMYNAISITQSKIGRLLSVVMSQKEATTKDLTTHFNDELYAIKSEDNKLYHFSLDEKTGGSYRSRMSWMYYLKNNSYVEVDAMNSETDTSIFFSDGYDEIKTFNTYNKTRYLLFGNVMRCNACFEEYVTLTHFEDGAFQLDFEYSVSSRIAEQHIFYDDISRSISVFYDTDDLTTVCYCSNEGTDNRDIETISSSDIDDTEQFTCSCLFEFNGRTYKLTKQCSEVIKTKD
ncbi:hypothetical protein [uncultured Psychroserpens sp.]|uniref:hypothetical protein n=1 Tax=uncultured Psychroserpens sp. TaxID=255436 RepID=UPI002629A7C9|nr:hypothetical protein [uncultured Psychroserpens sp.]